MKTIRFSVLSVLTVLALEVFAAGCGSGVSGAPETFSTSVPDVTRNQPVAGEGSVEEKGTGSEADSMVLRDEMKSYTGDAESPIAPPLEGAMKIDGPVPGGDAGSGETVVSVPEAVATETPASPAVEPAGNPVDTTFNSSHAADPSITPAGQAPATVSAPQEYVANMKLSATANYSQPSTPKMPVARAICGLPGFPNCP